jgi:flagellar hook assembly protein FlgD
VVTAADGTTVTRRVDLHQNVPNPFNPRTEIRFDLPVAGAYEVVIHDPAGRKVIGLRGTGSAGPNAIAWDGRDAQGADVASGVYHYRLITADGEAARKMILVR